MKKISFYQDDLFMGARYEFERSEFGEDTFSKLSNQLEGVISELPDNSEAKLQEFYFVHPFYEMDMPIQTPLTLGELKQRLEFFVNKRDRLHRHFLMTFLPDSHLEYQLQEGISQ
jgi:hypothetical protein